MKQTFLLLVLLGSGVAFAQNEQTKQEPEQLFVATPQPPEIVNGHKVYPFTEEPAQFPGGATALRKFLANNMVYPQRAVEEGLQGKCYITFIVSAEGELLQPIVQKGVHRCPECDAEALRIISIMPKWIPAKEKGKAVYSRFNLPFSYTLAD